MFKLTTKRDRHEEQALRDEGAAAVDDARLKRIMADIRAQETVKDVAIVGANHLRAGDVLVEVSTPRRFYRAARIVRAETTYEDGTDTAPGTVWVSYEPMPGTRNSGSSLMKYGDPVLIEAGWR